MLSAVQKLVLIPVLTLSAGFFISMGEPADIPQKKLYPEHLVGAFTGGFGEETCHSCHFDYDLNWKEGELSVRGIPESVEAGKTYEIELIITRPDMGKSGFQMTSRFKNGRQAGSFQIKENERVMFTKLVPDSIEYLQHSVKGTEPTKDGKNSWAVIWRAPMSVSDSIYFNITSNAANGDQSEFGDWIYRKEFVVE
ncbi:MAG TPA: choice-of-anchor V domain-containing protein [Gracilimonas sp.]|uniref:choice-of-anchor V domain-containing protein n=1 Tax=Gracilimonas sp. TaxID=1974203 RepID=UPI002D84D9AD|nr:choice-of-anchor V domain-containing protein [Gracilimonas sp.]